MQYLHVPVDWDNPLTSEFDHCADYMQRGKDSKTLLHCQINLRASTFSFLYRLPTALLRSSVVNHTADNLQVV